MLNRHRASAAKGTSGAGALWLGGGPSGSRHGSASNTDAMQCLEAGDDDIAIAAFDILDDMVECTVPILKGQVGAFPESL